MAARTAKKYILVSVLAISLFGFLYQYNGHQTCFSSKPLALTEYVGPERYVVTSEDGKEHKFMYDRSIPLIFIGGMPRSGTTLLRVLLDAHPDIRCGEETRVVPRILGLRQQWMKAPFESRRLQEAGVTSEVLDSAVAAFILEIIAKHGPPSTRLCNKDPFTLRTAMYLKQIFPNSKFIFMIRDGRAVVHSLMTRKVTISGFDLKDYRQCMKKWNSALSAMHYQCTQLGPSVCLPVYYEQLVLRPQDWLRKILSFLDVPWNDTVLHHEKFVNKPGGISLSKLERSTDQVIKPINIEALSKWVGQIPEDVVKDMAEIAPMLRILGYDPNANPPDYGKPDSFVMRKMEEIEKNKDVWRAKENEVVKERESIRSHFLKTKGSVAVGDQIVLPSGAADGNNFMVAGASGYKNLDLENDLATDNGAGGGPGSGPGGPGGSGNDELDGQQKRLKEQQKDGKNISKLRARRWTQQSLAPRPSDS